MHIGSKYTEVWFCFGSENMLTGTRLRVGKLAHEKVYNYMEVLTNFVPPKNRCMQYHCYFVLHSHPFKSQEQMKLDQSLYIIVTNTTYVNYLCGAKDAKGCLCNLKCGKCMDPFVRECIGKRFFALEYMKEHNYTNTQKTRGI